MSSNPCDLVAERVALGEPLGDVAEHAASCPRCRAIAALPTEIGAVHREADPGIGFTARMTAGAQHRFAARRRRRIAAGMATAVAATTLGVFFVTRSPQTGAIEPPIPPTTPATATNPPNDPWNPDQERPSAADDDDLASLVYFADTDRAAAQTANWKEIAKPLRPYRAVVEGVEP
ncbi:MAG: hypothetical protein HOV81_06360 [Kofleriaceae bacterium]|nr:hypothetical protein [Kofleriaceae bacterium]